MAQWRGIQFTEHAPDSAVEQAARDQSRVLRILDFQPFPEPLTHQRREFIRKQFLGYAQVRSEIDGRTWLQRVTPHFYPAPDLDSGPYLYAVSFAHTRWMGPGASENTPLHAPGDQTAIDLDGKAWWRCHVEYETPPWDIKEDDQVHAEAGPLVGLPDEGDCLRRGWITSRFINRQVQRGGRVVPLRAGAFRLVGVADGHGTPMPTGEPFPWNQPFDDVVYTWECPYIAYPAGAIRECLGAVNDAEFDGYPTDTLLLMSAPEVIRKDRFGQWIVRVQYSLRFMPNFRGDTCLGHQAVLHYGILGPGYRRISTDGTDDPDLYPFRRVDFSRLFRPA